MTQLRTILTQYNNAVSKLEPARKEVDRYYKIIPVGQPSKPFLRAVDRMLKLGERPTEIWNEHLRHRIVPNTNKTFWQMAIQNGKYGVKDWGEELSFTWPIDILSNAVGIDLQALINE